MPVIGAVKRRYTRQRDDNRFSNGEWCAVGAVFQDILENELIRTSGRTAEISEQPFG